jgi:gluconolactonase
MGGTPEFEVIAEGLAFPEGPVVMADGSVIVVEVMGSQLIRCWGGGRKEVVAEPGGGPNGLAVGPDGALYHANNGGIDWSGPKHLTGPGSEGRIERIDIATGKVERLYDSFEGEPISAPNDLVFDKQGNIWFTDLGKIRKTAHDLSVLYCAKPDGSSIRRVHWGMCGFNGVGLSPDEKTAYVAETFSARLIAIDTDPNSTSKPRLVGTGPGQVGFDSLAVTAAGNICVATLEQGGITSFTPDGKVSKLDLPDHSVTNIAFGGDDMRDAYITLSGSGKLVKMRWPEPGLKLNFNA